MFATSHDQTGVWCLLKWHKSQLWPRIRCVVKHATSSTTQASLRASTDLRKVPPSKETNVCTKLGQGQDGPPVYCLSSTAITSSCLFSVQQRSQKLSIVWSLVGNEYSPPNVCVDNRQPCDRAEPRAQDEHAMEKESFVWLSLWRSVSRNLTETRQIGIVLTCCRLHSHEKRKKMWHGYDSIRCVVTEAVW